MVVTCDDVTRCRVSRRRLSRHCLALILTNGPASQCADHAAIRELPHTRLQSVRRWGLRIFMFYLNVIYGMVEMVDLNGPDQKLFDT